MFVLIMALLIVQDDLLSEWCHPQWGGTSSNNKIKTNTPGKSTKQHHSSFGHSTQMALGCVQLTTKANHHRTCGGLNENSILCSYI